MNIICQYSGVNFAIGGFGSTTLTYVHPIFAAEPKWLLSRMGTWAAQRFDEQESKLLFLGLLHSTQLVEFRNRAEPDNNVVQLNMEPLARFVAWMCGLSNPHVVFPKFVISRETKSLNNVRYWIKTWQDAKNDFESGYTTQHLARQLRDKEAALERLIKNASRSVEDYAGLLATWAFQATAVPANLQDYWRSLFCLRGVAVYSARAVDLEEMLDHMEEHLEHGSIYAHATLQHVRTIVRKNKAGLHYGLGISDDDFAILETSPFRIVEGSVEQHNIDVVAASAPVDEPVATNFPSRLAFLRAHAAWKLAARARQYAEAFTQEVADAEKEDNQQQILDDDVVDESEFSGDLPFDTTPEDGEQQ